MLWGCRLAGPAWRAAAGLLQLICAWLLNLTVTAALTFSPLTPSTPASSQHFGFTKKNELLHGRLGGRRGPLSGGRHLGPLQCTGQVGAPCSSAPPCWEPSAAFLTRGHSPSPPLALPPANAPPTAAMLGWVALGGLIPGRAPAACLRVTADASRTRKERNLKAGTAAVAAHGFPLIQPPLTQTQMRPFSAASWPP